MPRNLPRRRSLTLLACLALALAAAAGLPGVAAQELPRASSVMGEIRRDADGRLIVVPAAEPAAAPAASPPAPGTPPAPQPAPAPRAAKEQGSSPRPAAPQARPPRGPARPAACPATAITCIEAAPAGTPAPTQPVTFGQAFAPGDVPSGAQLSARDARGHDVPLQVDQKASHPDGSLRFAVLSAEIPDLAAGERRQVSLFLAPGGRQAAAAARAVPGMGALTVDLDVYDPQVSVVVFGNREGHAPGIPFLAGETVTLQLQGGGTAETFSVAIAGPLAGGTLGSYTKLAEAFVAEINAGSRTWLAYKVGEGGGFDKLWITTRSSHHGAFEASSRYGGTARIGIQRQQAFASPVRYSARFDGRAALNPAAAGASWLSGPVVSETVLTAPLASEAGAPHAHLAARVHWRQYHSSGAVRADVVLENTWAYEPGPRNRTYDITIRRDGAVAWTHKGVNHFHHARWHAVVWSEGRAEPDVRPNVEYLLGSGAVPHYDPAVTVPESVLAGEHQALSKADTRPFGTALVTPYMPMTGGRADIGPLPRWAALYLLTMDPRARAVLLANADAGAGIPIHYRDKGTGLPVSLDDHPRLAMQLGKPSPKDAFPAVSGGETPWSPDTSHLPSLSFVPYLVTGDLFHLDEMQFWANWVMGSLDPGYRDGGRGLVSPNQIRAQAWSLRTLGEAAVFTPDGHPLKRYFATRLAGNVTWYLERYARNPDPQQAPRLGFIPKPDQPDVMGPWQQDYLFLAVGHLWELGVPGAEEFARWLARFSVGRWTSEASGYCQKMAPAYYIKIRRARDNTLIDTWADLFRENWDPAAGCPPTFPFGYPDSPGGYVAVAYGMLGLATDMGVPGAREALARLKAETPQMLGRFAEDPTFAIAPRR